jgi:hypothetical protein
LFSVCVYFPDFLIYAKTNVDSYFPYVKNVNMCSLIHKPQPVKPFASKFMIINNTTISNNTSQHSMHTLKLHSQLTIAGITGHSTLLLEQSTNNNSLIHLFIFFQFSLTKQCVLKFHVKNRIFQNKCLPCLSNMNLSNVLLLRNVSLTLDQSLLCCLYFHNVY